MPPATKIKRGRLSQADKDYIERFRRRKGVTEMAAQLRRAASQIAEYIAATDVEAERPKMAHRLEDRPEWPRFQDQFDQSDLDFLKYRYDQLMGQFGWDDVTGTEEMQIFNLIELEIMSRQSMAERKPLVTQQRLISKKLEGLYEDIGEAEAGSGDAKHLIKQAEDLEAKLPEISTQLRHINTRHESYSKQVRGLLEDLKGTRDQRIKVATGGSATFLGHLKALQLEEYRQDVGDEMEIMRVAHEKEKARMSRPLKYADGVTDQPLLTSETVMATYEEETATGPAPD